MMAKGQNEEALLIQAGQGDREAFGDLYERYLHPIYRYIHYRVGTHEDAEDLTETVFLKAWQHIRTFDREQGAFKAWLFRIAHNVVIDHYRTQKRPLSLDNHPPMEDKQPTPETTIANKLRQERLRQALQRLSPLHQHVLTLRFINGMSAAEAGAVLDKSAGAVRVLQHRALKALHAYFTAEDVIDE